MFRYESEKVEVKRLQVISDSNLSLYLFQQRFHQQSDRDTWLVTENILKVFEIQFPHRQIWRVLHQVKHQSFVNYWRRPVALLRQCIQKSKQKGSCCYLYTPVLFTTGSFKHIEDRIRPFFSLTNEVLKVQPNVGEKGKGCNTFLCWMLAIIFRLSHTKFNPKLNESTVHYYQLLSVEKWF